jgi:hypothetical protein
MQVTCTKFKASKQTNLTRLRPHLLPHAPRGTSDYRLVLKHDTLIELKLVERTREPSFATLLNNSETGFLSTT